MKNKLLFCLLVALFACKIKENDSESTTFFNYLKEVHNLNPDISDHYYFILELDGCQKCNYMMVQNLNNIDLKNDKLTIIISYTGKTKPAIFDNLEIKYKIIYENRKQFYKTSLGYLGHVIIKTNNNKIIEKFLIDDENDILTFFDKINK